MLTHRPTVMKAAYATIIFTIIALLTLMTYQGAAAQGGESPPQPSNPMAHLIAGQGQEPQVRISWDAPSEGTVTSHTVNRDDGQSSEVPGGATTHSDRAITPGMSYSYTVTAHNGAGDSPASQPVPAQVPARPHSPRADDGDGREPRTGRYIRQHHHNLAVFNDTRSRGLRRSLPGHRIRGGESPERHHHHPGHAGPGGRLPHRQRSGFGTEYTYRVYAKSDIGTGPAATATLTTPLRPVGTPSGLTAGIADPFDGTVSLSWNAPSEGPAIAGYLVVRYLGADPYQGTDIPTTLDEMATGTTLVDATPEAGVAYSYIVMARSAYNVGPPSNTAIIEAPAAPSALTANAGDGAIDLAWTAPAAGTTTGYRAGAPGAETTTGRTSPTPRPPATRTRRRCRTPSTSTGCSTGTPTAAPPGPCRTP